MQTIPKAGYGSPAVFTFKFCFDFAKDREKETLGYLRFNIPSQYTYGLGMVYTKSRDIFPPAQLIRRDTKGEKNSDGGVIPILLYIKLYPLYWILCGYETISPLGVIKPWFIK